MSANVCFLSVRCKLSSLHQKSITEKMLLIYVNMYYCQIPDVVNANAAVTPALPVPITDATSSGSGTAASSGAGFKARKGSRSSPRTASRPQNASKPGAAAAVAADGTDTSKQKQSHVQVEKRNQAIAQLRRLLVQGNKRVEALATVVQHLFTEVLQLFSLQQ